MIPSNVKPGGTLTVAIGTDVSSFDTQQSTETSSQGVRLNLYDPLLWVANQKYTVLPWLASKWDISSDGLTYTFTLIDKPVKFHDGTDFNVDAVKATFDRLMGPNKSTAAAIDLGMIGSVEVVDKSTVKFTLSKPFAPFLVRIAGNSGAILSPDAIQKYGQDYSTHPIGTGPYKFVEYRKGDHATFEKFADYWNGTVYYDKMIYKIVPEDASRATLVQTGEAQVSDRIPPVLALQMKDRNDVTVRADLTSRYVMMELNQNHTIMQDARVRQAINYGVDNESIVKNILKGYGAVPDAPIPKGAQFYSQQQPYTYNVDKAKSLLKDAGIAQGTPLTIWSPQGRYVGDKDIATAVQSMMNDLGFNASVRVFGDFPTYIKELDSLDYDMAIWGWVSPDPDTGLNYIYSGQYVKGFPNWGSYNNPQVNQLLQSAVATPDESKQADLYAQAQKIIWDEAAVLWLDWQENLTGLSTKVDNVFDDLGEVLVVRFSGYKS